MKLPFDLLPRVWVVPVLGGLFICLGGIRHVDDQLHEISDEESFEVEAPCAVEAND
jgi:hypothetical protein